VLHALILSVALAAEPSVPQFDPWSTEAIEAVRAVPPLEPRRVALRKTGAGLVIGGAATLAVALPIGALAAAIGEQTMCAPQNHECMSAPLLGAGLGGGLAILGIESMVAGGICFAVDAGLRARDRRRFGLSVGFGPNHVVVAGRF